MAVGLSAVILAIMAYLSLLAPKQNRLNGQSHDRTNVPTKQSGNGNKNIKDFYHAKKKAHDLYKGMETTFYCGCRFSGKLVDHQTCGFKPIQEDERSYRLEWEHIVPAYNFGRSFSSWREGHAQCVNSKGKKYRGRRCARKVSVEFNLMEADLYNLVPAIGEVNNRRGSLPMGVLAKKVPSFGKCQTLIDERMIEPRDQVKGFIARTYLYMDQAYPGHGIISRKNKKLMDAWNASYPPSTEEIKRAKRIAIIQGNINPYLGKAIK